MSEADARKWDARYAAGEHADLNRPCSLLQQQIDTAPAGHALDVACGAGRNALFMARRGFIVDAIDISAVGLRLGQAVSQAENLPIDWLCMDLADACPLPRQDYALIVMSYFIAPELLARLPMHLAPGGIIVIEQHLQWQPVPAGGLSGPSSGRFRVASGSLSALLRQVDPALEILVDEEDLFPQPEGPPAALARLTARRPHTTG